MSRRILITGGLGFQGAHLAAALLQLGHEVTCLNTPSARAEALDDVLASGPLMDADIVWGNVADLELLEKLLPQHDTIFHLAAWASVDVSLDRPAPPFEINAQGTYILLDGIRQIKPSARVLVASSCEVYGPASRIVRPPSGDDETFIVKMGLRYASEQEVAVGLWAQSEQTPHMPRSPYAATKSAADRFAYAFAVAYNLNLTIVRPCNIYGPYQRAGAAGAVIPTMTQAALTASDTAAIYITGGGQQSREFLRVEDVVAAYVLLMGHAHPPGEAFNVGSGEVRTVAQIAEAVRMHFDLPHGRVIHLAGRSADVTGFLQDASKLTALGWKPTIPFDEGLRSYFEWAQGPGKPWLTRF